MPNKNILNEFFENQKVPVWGVAGLKNDNSVILPESLQNRFVSAIVYAFPVADAILDSLSGGPDILYLHHYRQINYLLDRVGLHLVQLLQQNGFSGLPVPASQVVDWKEHRGLISHRHLAVAAGLGWLGRNNLLVTPEFGSRVRLASVLTDAPFTPDKPTPFGCGECTWCLSRCPAKAIREDQGGFDRQACQEFILKTCRQKNIKQNICGLCLCSGKNRVSIGDKNA